MIPYSKQEILFILNANMLYYNHDFKNCLTIKVCFKKIGGRDAVSQCQSKEMIILEGVS